MVYAAAFAHQNYLQSARGLLALKNMIACFVGGIVGAFLFFLLASYFLGHPYSDWFHSAYGILGAEKQRTLSGMDRAKVYDLLVRGLIIPSDSVISNLTDLYGNMIQTLIGVLALATVLAAFAVRWQSVQAAQEYVDQKATSHFSSSDFKMLVSTSVADYVDTLDPNLNPQVAPAALQASLRLEISDLRDRLAVLEHKISSSASAEEPEADEE